MEMQEKYNDSTRNRPFGERTIDIAAYIQQLKSEEAWTKNDRNAITVFKTDAMRHVLVALHNGATMSKEAAEGVMSLQVLEGRLSCRAADQQAQLAQGQIVTIAEGVSYEIRANEESCFLLTMSAPL
jgi:quercetin dioxygenase-like cupin family protein